MKYFESWWNKAASPASLRIVLAVVGLVAMVLGGGADEQWG